LGSSGRLGEQGREHGDAEQAFGRLGKEMTAAEVVSFVKQVVHGSRSGKWVEVGK
jgi:hypothetical protein